MAFCGVFIAYFFCYYVFLYWAVVGDFFRTANGFTIAVVIFVISFLISIPLILSGKGGTTIRNAGWLGAFNFPLIFAVIYIFGIRPSDLQGAGALWYWFCLGFYFLIAIILCLLGRRRAKKELSES
jgi:hypothetical protein